MSSEPECFCLCDDDFVQCSCPNLDGCKKCQQECIQQPAAKKNRLGLSLKSTVGSRFAFLSGEDADQLKKTFVPGNTKRATNWALKVFTEWRKAREDQGLEVCPGDILERPVVDDLCKWLPIFAAESRNSKERAGKTWMSFSRT